MVVVIATIAAVTIIATTAIIITITKHVSDTGN
jgi:hypothetical protein